MKTDRPLPLRWTAPEVVTKLSYSVRSDVYAFGVFVFEVYSFGAFPFAQIVNDQSFLKLLGGTNVAEGKLDPSLAADLPSSKVQEAPVEVRTLLTECLSRDSNARPTFAEIVKRTRAMAAAAATAITATAVGPVPTEGAGAHGAAAAGDGAGVIDADGERRHLAAGVIEETSLPSLQQNTTMPADEPATMLESNPDADYLAVGSTHANVNETEKPLIEPKKGDQARQPSGYVGFGTGKAATATSEL
jgi:serine/threonine protein kinase